MKYQKTAAFLALLGTLASLPAKADCYQVTTDQNGQPLYRCDQPVVTQQVVSPIPGQQPVYQATGQLSSTEGMVIGAVGGLVLGSILAGDHDRGYRGGYGYHYPRHVEYREYRRY
jgi:hypothetical protein